MKTIAIAVILGALLQAPASTNAQSYFDTDTLYVAATSGLRLRMQPNMNSPTIKVLEFTDPVTVAVGKTSSTEHRSDRVQWMEGHWVRVRHEGVAGYVFDGFLTKLKPFSHEDQLCIGCVSLVIPLNNYIEANYHFECIEEDTDTTEELMRTITLREGGISSTAVNGEGWYQMEYAFDNYRLSEILNLLRAMIVSPQDRSDFERNLVFHENSAGVVNRVDLTINNYSTGRIEYYDDNLVLLTLLTIEPEGLTGG